MTLLFYLDVWERYITYVEDDRIREAALGGADTCIRSKVVWQVKLLRQAEGFALLRFVEVRSSCHQWEAAKSAPRAGSDNVETGQRLCNFAKVELSRSGKPVIQGRDTPWRQGGRR